MENWKNETSRKNILKHSKNCNATQTDKQLAIPSHRKRAHITLEEYKDLIKSGKSVQEINKTTSKHLTGVYNALIKGRINLSKEKFHLKYKGIKECCTLCGYHDEQMGTEWELID